MYSFLPHKIKFLNLALDIITPLLFVKKMIKFFILCRSKKKKKKSGHLDTIWHCYYFLYKLDINNFSKSIFYFQDVLFIWIGNRWLKWRKLTFFLIQVPSTKYLRFVCQPLFLFVASSLLFWSQTKKMLSLILLMQIGQTCMLECNIFSIVCLLSCLYSIPLVNVI